MKKIIAIAAAGLMLAGCTSTTDSTTDSTISGERMVMVSFEIANEAMPQQIDAVCQTVDLFGMEDAFTAFYAGWKTTNSTPITQADFEPAINRFC